MTGDAALRGVPACPIVFRFRRPFGLFLLAALAVSPCASAQTRDALVQHVVVLTNALGGAFGDEGPQVTRAIDDLEAALAQWDASIARAERGFAADLPGAPPAAASEMLAAIGALYVQRGRMEDGIRQLTAALGLPSPRSRGTVVQLLAAAQRASGQPAAAGETLLAEWRQGTRDPILAVLVAEGAQATRDEWHALVDTLVAAALSPGSVPPSPFVSLALIEDASVTTPIFPPARYADAYARLLQGDFGPAIRGLREAAATDPLISGHAAQPPAYWTAIAALRLGELAPAIAALQEVVGQVAHSSEAHRILATALWADGRLADAGAEFNRAIEREPADERAYLALADVLRDGGDDRAVEQALARAAAAIPASAQSHWGLGRLYEQMQRDDEAIAEYRRAQRSVAVAGAAQVSAAIGRVRHSRLDLEGATQAYQQRVAAVPNSAASHQALGDVLQARDLHEAAAVEFLAAHLLQPDAASLAAAAQSLLAQDRDADAESIATRALALDAANLQARYTLAVVLARRGRDEEAQRQLDEYRRRQEDALAARRRRIEIDSYKLQAQVWSQSGDHVAAAAAWQQAIAAEGPTPDTVLRLAREQAAAGQIDLAAEAYATAVRLRPEPAVQRELVTLLETAGRSAAAAAARDAYEQMKRDRLRRLGGAR